MTGSEETALAKRAARGDADAFERIVCDNEKLIYAVAYKLLGNAQDAEDAVQETFLKAYLSLASFRGDSKMSVWLYRIANNVCIDALRKRRDALSLTDAEDAAALDVPDTRCDPAAQAERREQGQQLAAALDRLNAEQREVLILREIHGYSYEEIADATGLDIGTVKSRIFRGRKKLCAILSEDGNFFDGCTSKGMKGGVQA